MRLKYWHNHDPRINDFNEYIAAEFPELITEADPELILVAGGDGAMLRAIQTRQQADVPFFGKGMGTLNFLMNQIEDDGEFIRALLAGEISLDILSTSSLKVCINNNGTQECIAEAVNDVVVGSDLMGYHEFEITTADEAFQDFAVEGTGICVSTPLGSTAYNFNNAGKILPLDSNLWSLTGVVCNRYLNDVLVEQELKIKIGRIKGGVDIFIDGQVLKSNKIGEGSEIYLVPGDKYRIAFLEEKQFLRRRNEVAHRFRKTAI